MPVKSATLTAISDDTGTPGDFKTIDTTLGFSGTYQSTGSAKNLQLFVFVDGVSVGEATLNTSTTWSLPYNSATESFTRRFSYDCAWNERQRQQHSFRLCEDD